MGVNFEYLPLGTVVDFWYPKAFGETQGWSAPDTKFIRNVWAERRVFNENHILECRKMQSFLSVISIRTRWWEWKVIVIYKSDNWVFGCWENGIGDRVNLGRIWWPMGPCQVFPLRKTFLRRKIFRSGVFFLTFEGSPGGSLFPPKTSRKHENFGLLGKIREPAEKRENPGSFSEIFRESSGAKINFFAALFIFFRGKSRVENGKK